MSSTATLSEYYARNDNFSRREKFASFGGTFPSFDGVKNLSGSVDIPESLKTIATEKGILMGSFGKLTFALIWNSNRDEVLVLYEEG